MGFVKPTLPDVPIADFRRLDRRDRIRVGVQDWVDHGFGTPKAILLVYVLKIVGYVVGGAAIIAATTPGLGGLSDIASWWTEPIVLQKAVLWTLAFEVLGLGCGFGPLTFHFMPPLTAPVMWLRPGTTRLPPWPEKVPLTGGHTRALADVVLYLAVVGATFWAMTRPGDVARVPEGFEVGLLDPVTLVPLLVLLPLLGLRDKAIFLAARSEQYLVLAALFLFAYPDLLTGAKWVLVATWWGAATSKLNQHFPYVVSTMLTNAPFRPRAFRRALFRRYPDDLRPSALAAGLAHTGTVIEFLVPLAMIVGGGGTLTRIGVVVMVVFHLHIISALPLGVPLEWNVFFIYATVYLFGVHADVSMVPSSPLLVVFLLAALVAMPVLGNLRPDLVSFLPAMRYYAGNWATSLWLMSPEGERRFHEGLKKVSPSIQDQLAYLYDEDTIEFLTHKSYAFRSMHSHGRALNGLERRAVDDPEAYSRHEGEIVAGLALGWNFGEGHLHDESLVRALQAQCGFAPGEVRVVYLESQPIGHPHQEYRIIDAASGEVERGTVAVADMVGRQPWLDDADLPFPVTVTEPRPAAAGRT
jgi:hypothetical protein